MIFLPTCTSKQVQVCVDLLLLWKSCTEIIELTCWKDGGGGGWVGGGGGSRFGLALGKALGW